MVRIQDLEFAVEKKFGARVTKLIRYIFSGGTAAVVNWTTLFLLVHLGGMYYLSASIVAFMVSIAVSFAMQKFWTFRDNVTHDIHLQFTRYSIVISLSLLLNTTLVYVLVEKIHMWYLLAQVTATTIIAIVNFFAYRKFVFKQRNATETNSLTT